MIATQLTARLALLSVLLIATSCGSQPNGSFKPKAITLTEVEGTGLKELDRRDLIFVDSEGLAWTAPKGTLTDGASVPRLALFVTDGRFDENFLKAAVVHDAYCQEENETRTPEQFRKRPWQDVHRMFYEACLAGGTSELQAKLMFAAVYLAGPQWDASGETAETLNDDELQAGYAATKDLIAKGDVSIGEIEADVASRRDLLARIHRTSVAGDLALENGEVENARTQLEREEGLIKEKIERSPNDPMLLYLKGRLHNRKATFHEKIEQPQAAERELAAAEVSYRTMLNISESDPNAKIGLARVSISRGEFARARAQLDGVLVEAPKNAAALRELRRLQDRVRRPE